MTALRQQRPLANRLLWNAGMPVRLYARPVVPSELSQFILFILALASRPAPCGGPQLVLRRREESPR